MADGALYLDEEDCLGFGVFVAELELVLGTSRTRRPDQSVLLELLQKLNASICATSEPAALKQHQKRCEAALYEIIYKGPCAAVRSLVCSCLARLYTAGDLLPLFSRINGLQGFLQDKHSTATEATRLAVMVLLTHLQLVLGKCLASSALESMAIATKTHAKGGSTTAKAAALRLAGAVVEGLPPTDRNMAALQAEAWKLCEKHIKDKACDELRAQAAALLGALCRAGGCVLWSSAGYYADEALKAAVAGLDDAAAPTREAFALALADLAAAARPTNAALAAALDAEKRPAKRQALEKLAGSVFKAALVEPFVDAAVAGNKAITSALALAWSSFAASLVPTAPGADQSQALIDLALRAVSMLEQCSKAAAEAARASASAGDAGSPASNIGACLSGGEMPAASAAVIYFMRAAIIPQLPEPAQRQLLAGLARAASHAIAPPVIVAALEGCGVLLELLGEIHDGAAIKAVQNAASSKLAASSTAVRHQAAAVTAALALSSPPLLAVLFGECLEGVETFCQQLMLLAAPYTKRGGGSAVHMSASGGGGGVPGGNHAAPGTPRGAPDSQTKHCIDGLHGNALAVGALLVASARSALGAPARLTSSVFWIAKRMVSQPYCSCPWAVAAEREAGYILLGSMCAAAAPGLLAGRDKQAQVLELFSVALGPGAAEALATAGAPADGDGHTEPPHGSSSSSGSDLELAVRCWWRGAALQALGAYVLGVMGRGLADDPAQQVRLIAAMLLPLLDAVTGSGRLADPVAAAALGSAAGGGAVSSSTSSSSRAASPAPGPPLSPTPGSSGGAAAASGAGAASTGGAGSSSKGAAPPGGPAGGYAFQQQGLGPVAAAAAALLQLRLLEVFFFLPAPQLWASCHAQLLQLCCRQLLGGGGSRVRPDYACSVAASSLKHMLSSQDALLGPWLPGRDMLEDELRTFVGEPGGPQQHPWEVGAAFTTGFITHSQALLPPEDSEAASPAPAPAGGGAGGSGAAGSSSSSITTTTMLTSSPFTSPQKMRSAHSSSHHGAQPLQQHGCAQHDRQQARQQQQLQWERGVDGLRLRRRFMPYPQPYALGPALLEAQMWLLGKLLSVVPPATQLKVLEVMLGAVSVRPGLPPAQRTASSTAVAMAALAGLGPLARRSSRGEAVAGGDKLAARVLQLASYLLEDQVSDSCLARAGAELMAAATCIGSTALAQSQAKAIAEQLLAEAGAASSDPGATAAGASAELRSVLCLVLGCIFRTRGGASLQPLVSDTVAALVAVASRPVRVTHMWALHALWLVARAAGTGYAAHVKQSLQLALELLVSSYGDNPLLQPAAAQLANAMVAVLGPQFTLGSLPYSRCKTLVTDNTGGLSAALAAAKAAYAVASSGAAAPALGSGAGGGGAHAAACPTAGVDGLRGLAATCSELEQVLFAQQLILFAPEAVAPAKHLPLLLLTLTSTRPTLRRAAAATLWHLADRHAAALALEHIDAALLSALDAESEASTAAEIRAALSALLAASAPARPGYWVRLLGAVALAASPPVTAAGAAVAGGGGHAAAAGTAAFRSDSPADDNDDDDEAASRGARPAAAGAPAATPTAAAAGGVGGGGPGAAVGAADSGAAVAAALARLPATPRLRTRLFAAQALLSLFGAVGSDAHHWRPAARHDGGPGGGSSGGGAPAAAGQQQHQADALVSHLQVLIDLGFKLTTGSAESLQPSGVQLLQLLLRCYGAVPDPDVPEMLLLEQYQAQFVSALRAALKPGVAPALAVCGGTLATTFLSAGLAAGDGAVMMRLMDLLVAPLQVWQVLLYGGFAESVGVKARVALLQAHAQCANLAAAFRDAAASSSSSSSSSSRRGFDPGRPRAADAAEAGAAVAVRPGCFSPNSSINNELCASIVVKAQGPFMDMLLLLWWGVLLDFAAFSSPLPGVRDSHKSLLFGDTYPEVVQAITGAYSAAWPAVLVALASNLPGPQQLAVAAAAAAGGDGSGAGHAQEQQQQQQVASWSSFVDLVSSGADMSSAPTGRHTNSVGGAPPAAAAAAAGAAASAAAAGSRWSQQLQLQCARMHATLLDICLMLCAQAAAAAAAALSAASQSQQQEGVGAGEQALPAAAVAAARKLAVALQALQLLLTKEHLQAGLVRQDVCRDVVVQLSALAQGVLLPWLQHTQQQHTQTSPSAADAAGSSDRVFGAILLAAAQLLHALSGSAACVVGPASSSDAATPAALFQGVLQALLALSGIAVPHQQYSVVPASNGATQCSAGSMAGFLPAFAQQHHQQQCAAASACLALQTCAPSAQAVDAARLLCQAGAALMQQQGQWQLQPDAAASAQAGVARLALRLLLTAAPGQQLAAAQTLLEACISTAQAATNTQHAAAEACGALCDAVAAAVDQLTGAGSSGTWRCVADAAARLPVLLSALLCAAGCCHEDAVAVDGCCGVLVWALKRHDASAQQRCAQDTAAGDHGGAFVACTVLGALRQLLQDQQQQQAGRAALAQRATAAVVPQVAVLVHDAMRACTHPLAGHELGAVTEALKVLLLMSTAAAARGEAAQVAVLSVLLPLLVEVATPPGGAPVTPLLRIMACKLVSAMPTSAAAGAFRVAVAALPASSKARLQAALREQAAAEQQQAAGVQPATSGASASQPQPGAGTAGAAAPRKPAIQLTMNFQVPKPTSSGD